jgi:membrane protein
VTPPPAIRSAVERVLGLPAVRTARRVVDSYGAAGGGLLAGGLTYSAVFAILPALLLIAGLVGLVVHDAERRVAIVSGIGRALPPLAGLVANVLDRISDDAGAYGVLGLVALTWGASHFYGSLDEAFGRIFRDAPRRGFVVRTIRGLLSVLLLVAVFVAALALTGLASYLARKTETALGAGSEAFWQIASPLLAGLVFVTGTVAVYRLVPARSVPWRALLLPAVVVGVLLTLLTQLFSLIAPLLIGVASVYAAFVTIFAVMIWLSTGFQILLVGAAWVRDRIPGDPTAVADPG